MAAEIDSGIPSNRVVLGGFSQGGAISLLAGVTCPQKLGGIFGLSCYLLLQGRIREMVPAENPNKDTPIFMGHGDADPVVQYDWGVKTAEKLIDWDWKVDFKTYPYVGCGFFEIVPTTCGLQIQFHIRRCNANSGFAGDWDIPQIRTKLIISRHTLCGAYLL